MLNATRFDAPVLDRHVKYSDADFVNGTATPFATSTFKYRSLGPYYLLRAYACLLTSTAALKSLGIIPRSPSPVPLEERHIDTLTPAEMREILQIQRVGSRGTFTGRQANDAQERIESTAQSNKKASSKNASRESAPMTVNPTPRATTRREMTIRSPSFLPSVVSSATQSFLTARLRFST